MYQQITISHIVLNNNYRAFPPISHNQGAIKINIQNSQNGYFFKTLSALTDLK